METTINYTDRHGKKRSKTFNNKDSLLDYLSDEVQRIEIRRLTAADKKEIRKLCCQESEYFCLQLQGFFCSLSDSSYRKS